MARFMLPLFGSSHDVVRFLYDFVTFPNGVFSGTIISSVVHNANIKQTAEWQLLLSTIALPGVFIGAWVLCERIGRRNTMIVGFSGYLVFGLIIGLAYEKITKIIPLFVILSVAVTARHCVLVLTHPSYGLMQSMGNLGPGNMLGLTSSESFATPVR
jgi:hypothetical protein